MERGYYHKGGVLLSSVGREGCHLIITSTRGGGFFSTNSVKERGFFNNVARPTLINNVLIFREGSPPREGGGEFF